MLKSNITTNKLDSFSPLMLILTLNTDNQIFCVLTYFFENGIMFELKTVTELRLLIRLSERQWVVWTVSTATIGLSPEFILSTSFDL